jgi:chitodextrinase
MHTNRVHAVFWGADGIEFPPGYTELIDRFFGDVAADNGQPSNVYAVTPEYGDDAGPAAYDSTYAGRIDDSTSYPAASCVSAARPRCLNGDNLTAELNRLIDSNGLPRGAGEIYAIFTPPGMSVCRTAGVCSPDNFCGVHDALKDHTPYMFVAAPSPGRCGGSAEPNDNVADAALSVVSHEHIETITDPLGTAWGDSDGQEIADKCRRSFGEPLGATATGVYNQLINGRPYWLQGEWSNAAGRCVLHAPVAAPTAVIAAPRAIARGRSAALDARRSSGLRLRSEWSLPDGSDASGPVVNFRFAEAGATPITLRVTDVVGQTATAEVTVDVRKRLRPVVHATRVKALRWRFSARRSRGHDGGVAHWRWRFSDGTRSRGRTAVHRFPHPGRYRVKLIVVDDSGAHTVTVRAIHVRG